MLLALWWIPYFIWKNNENYRKKVGVFFFWVNIPFYYFMVAPSFHEKIYQKEPFFNGIWGEIAYWGGLTVLIYGLSVTFFMLLPKAKSGNPGYDPKKLLTEGIFRYIRHPQLSGAFFISLGVACWQRAPYHLLLNLFYLIILGVHIWMEEYFLLLPRFGEEYQAYRKKSKAFVPFLA